MFLSRLGRRAVLGYSDSGITFDKIYLNKPKGYNKVGVLIDYILLNIPASKATRQRQKSLIKILTEQIDSNIKNNKRTRMLDLASGPARYLTELLNKRNRPYVEILCLDDNAHSIKYGKRISGSLPIRYIKANTFNLRHYKSLAQKNAWRPNIILASGLVFYYNNETIIDLFKDVFGYLDRGGIFIFDNLLNNPNKKLLLKVCVTTKGKPWDFFYRKPEQITGWLKEAGFTGMKYFMDKWKMYVIYSASKL